MIKQPSDQELKRLREKNIAKDKLRSQQKLAKQKSNNQKLLAKIAKQEKFQKHIGEIRKAKISQKIEITKKRFNQKIAYLTKLKASVDQKQIAKEKEAIANSFLSKYYLKRQSWINKKLTKKIAQVKYLEKIAKLTTEEVANKINKLEVDAKSLAKHWQGKINNLNNHITSEKYALKINKLIKERDKQITSYQQHLKGNNPTNWILNIKDRLQLFMSWQIRGITLNEYRSVIAEHLRKYSMFYILGLIIFIFGTQTDWANLKANQFINIIQGNTYILIIGMGMLLVIVAGYIDLSVGALMGFMGALSVKIFNSFNGNIFVTFLFTIIIGVLIGLFQGILIGYFKMPAFIVTLGGMLLFQGLILTITASKTLAPLTDRNGDSIYIEAILGSIPEVKVGNVNLISMLVVLAIGAIAILFIFLGRNKKIKYGIYKESAIAFGLKIMFMAALFGVLAYYVAVSFFGLKYYLLYIIVLIAAFIFITQNTAFGRNVYAIGGNKKAAKLSGINCELTTTYIFMIMGGMVGFASIVFTGIVTNAGPLVASAGYELDVISSVFVGGASMSGGIGSITGTFIGGLILGYINNGMFLLNFQADMQKIIKAIVLLLAVGYDIYSNRKIS